MPLPPSQPGAKKRRFHDVHHAFPNAVGTLSQRGRFHGWEKVHDAAAEVLHRGLWKPNGDEEILGKTERQRKGEDMEVSWGFHTLDDWNPTKMAMGQYLLIHINTIFRGMNIHLPAILMFTRGTRVLKPNQNNGMFTTYQLGIWISEPSAVGFRTR